MDFDKINAEMEQNKALLIGGVQWVDAEIELPVAYAPVLVCFKNEWVSAIRTAYWCGDSWIVNGNKPILTDKITYWMKLPNPPCA
jgi:hypothetical protein